MWNTEADEGVAPLPPSNLENHAVSWPRGRESSLPLHPVAGATPGTDGRDSQRHTDDLGTCRLTGQLLAIPKRSDLERGDTRVIIASSHLQDRVPDGRLFGAGRCHSGEADGVSKVALVHHSSEIQRRFADGPCRVRRA